MFEDFKAAGHGVVQAISSQTNSSEMLGSGMGESVEAVPDNATFLEANDNAQCHIAANLETLLSEIPLAHKDVISVPTLFRDSSFAFGLAATDDGLQPPPPFNTDDITEKEKQMMAFYPASINGIVIGKRYLSPKPSGPVVNGTDGIEKVHMHGRV